MLQPRCESSIALGSDHPPILEPHRSSPTITASSTWLLSIHQGHRQGRVPPLRCDTCARVSVALDAVQSQPMGGSTTVGSGPNAGSGPPLHSLPILLNAAPSLQIQHRGRHTHTAGWSSCPSYYRSKIHLMEFLGGRRWAGRSEACWQRRFRRWWPEEEEGRVNWLF
jgi:hypothetical protein